jgi:hypothetical protein
MRQCCGQRRAEVRVSLRAGKGYVQGKAGLRAGQG